MTLKNTLKKQCIKAIVKGSINYDELPKTLKDEITNSKDCCFTLNIRCAFYNGHYGCFFKAYDECKSYVEDGAPFGLVLSTVEVHNMFRIMSRLGS